MSSKHIASMPSISTMPPESTFSFGVYGLLKAGAGHTAMRLWRRFPVGRLVRNDFFGTELASINGLVREKHRRRIHWVP